MTKEEVMAIHRNVFYPALLNNDLEALYRLYSDDYMVVRTDGSVLNKGEILRGLKEDDLRFSGMTQPDITARTRKQAPVRISTGGTGTFGYFKGTRLVVNG